MYHVGVQSVFAELFRHEMSHGNVCLLVVSVPGDLYQLHAIEQSGGDGRGRVRRRDEQHLRQVKWNVQVAGIGVKSKHKSLLFSRISHVPGIYR